MQLRTILLLSAMINLSGCGQDAHHESEPAKAPNNSTGSHMHADGTTHADHEDPDHEEVDLGVATIGGMEIDFSQSHGALRPGKESHLVVRLPYSDNGATVVRAWLGDTDRTLSFVGKGAYVQSKDAYDVHAPAPDPLPDHVRWWIEIEKPDGEKAAGSIKPRLE